MRSCGNCPSLFPTARELSPLEKSSPHASRCVLVITDDSANAKLIRESLSGAALEPFRVEGPCGLADAMERLKQHKLAAIILDMSVPGSQGLEALDQVSKAAPSLPILILSGAEDEEFAKQALGRGAQDYLPKSHLNSYSLPRALQAVITFKLASEALFSDRERGRSHAELHWRCCAEH